MPRLLVLSLNVCLLGAAGAAGAQQDRGFYLAFEAGLVDASTLEAAISGADHPTRCDVLLYADPAMAPTGDPACGGPGSSPEVTNRFDLGTRFTGSLGIGYDLGRVRVELEHIARQHDGGTIHCARRSHRATRTSILRLPSPTVRRREPARSASSTASSATRSPATRS